MVAQGSMATFGLACIMACLPAAADYSLGTTALGPDGEAPETWDATADVPAIGAFRVWTCTSPESGRTLLSPGCEAGTETRTASLGMTVGTCLPALVSTYTVQEHAVRTTLVPYGDL